MVDFLSSSFLHYKPCKIGQVVTFSRTISHFIKRDPRPSDCIESNKNPCQLDRILWPWKVIGEILEASTSSFCEIDCWRKILILTTPQLDIPNARPYFQTKVMLYSMRACFYSISFSSELDADRYYIYQSYFLSFTESLILSHISYFEG